ncbi:MAG: tetratricopeptide repeat protein [Planctomycetales bacterium]|nr:tetratricopeptide repeat protein [Planctomycetales bacterium]
MEARAFLTDFGLAKSVATGSRLTRTGEALGTPAYMSPEQARGEVAELRPATDVWSLGCLLHEMLAGRPPFEGETAAATVGAILARESPRIGRLRPDLPRHLERLISAALRKRARERPAHAGLLREDLDRVLRGEAPRVPSPRRGRRLAALGAVPAALAAALLLASLGRIPSAPSSPAPASPAATEPDRLVARARSLRPTDPREAARLLGDALRAAPGRHEWRLESGLLLWSLGEDAAARAEWARIPAGAPEDPAARLYRGLEATFRWDGRAFAIAESLPDLEAAAAVPGPHAALARAALAVNRRQWAVARELLRPLSGWEAALLRAEAQSRDEGGDPQAALREYGRALEEGPPLPWAYVNRSRVRLILGGNPRGALEDCDAALRRAPGFLEALVNRGNARDELGDHAGAIADYDAALRAKPDHVAALANRGNTRLTLGDTAGALADLDAALALDPANTDARVNRAAVFGTLDRLKAALADLDEAIRLRPGLAEAWYNRGCIRAQRGDPAGAEKEYSEAVRLQPGHFRAFRNRASARESLGDLEGAAGDYSRSLELAPDQVEVRNCRAEVRQRLGNREGALEDFSEVLRREPGHPRARHFRGILRTESGDHAGASEDFRALAAATPDDPQAHANLGLALVELRDWPGAAVAFAGFLRLAPDHPRAHEIRRHLGECEERARAGAAAGR